MPIIYLPSAVRPSYQSGYAPRNGPPLNSGQWQGLKAAWAPSLGVTGLNLWDIAGGDTGVLSDSDMWAVGPNGPVLRADGISQFLSIPDAGNFERTDEFSVSFWVKPVDATTSFEAYVNRMVGSTTFRGWQIASGPSGQRDRVQFILRNDNAAGNFLAVYSSTPAFFTGVWSHIVVTYDGSSTPGGVKLYLNGTPLVVVTNTDNLSATILTSQPMEVAAQTAGSIFNPADFDIISLHERVLALSEIQETYQNQYALIQPAPMPIVMGTAITALYPHVPGMTGGIAV